MTGTKTLAATLWRASEADWQAVAKKSLGKKDLDSLVVHSDDGVAIGPIHRHPESSTAVRGRDGKRPWTIVQRVDDPDEGRAASFLEADLDGGASGIELILAGSASADRTGFGLPRIGPRLIETLSKKSDLQVRLDAGTATYEQYRHFSDVSLRKLTLCFDPLAHAAACGGFDQPPSALEDAVGSAALDFLDQSRNGFAVVGDGRVWAASGASEAQEIAAILGSVVYSSRLLIERGISPEAALGSIGLVVDASANQVLTIAKLRALRLCHARLVEAFTAEPIPAEVHAETSWRMMTRDDVYTNILRATSAALAAGIAGADSVTILPCTVAAGLPDAFARRVARNTQTILLEESGLASVSDPGSGSGVIESLTASLAEKAWSIFRKNEAAGGLAEALRLGSFQQEIANTSQIRAERTAQRERAITGISKFPNIEETDAGVVMARPPDTTQPTEWVEPIERLRATRFAEPFEGLRDRASDLGRTGSAPKVFLANLGHPIDFVDAAQAATNLFAVGGIAVIETEGFETPVEAAQAFSASGTPFACINGSKDMSPEVVEAAARALKERGAQRVFIMDGNASGDSIDAILHEEVDVIAVISDILSLAEANRKQAH